MHSTHYDDPISHTGWAFHHNGDPVPGDVLINQRDLTEWETFRTTAEEIAIFVLAVKLGAMPPILVLNSTSFDQRDDMVILRSVVRKQLDDAPKLEVPLYCLVHFASDMAVMKYEMLNPERSPDHIMAGLGLLSLYLGKLSPDDESE